MFLALIFGAFNGIYPYLLNHLFIFVFASFSPPYCEALMSTRLGTSSSDYHISTHVDTSESWIFSLLWLFCFSIEQMNYSVQRVSKSLIIISSFTMIDRSFHSALIVLIYILLTLLSSTCSSLHELNSHLEPSQMQWTLIDCFPYICIYMKAKLIAHWIACKCGFSTRVRFKSSRLLE